MQIHGIMNSKMMFHCFICKKGHETIRILSKHLKKDHLKNYNEGPLICPFSKCDVPFADRKCYQNHLRSHVNKAKNNPEKKTNGFTLVTTRNNVNVENDSCKIDSEKESNRSTTTAVSSTNIENNNNSKITYNNEDCNNTSIKYGKRKYEDAFDDQIESSIECSSFRSPLADDILNDFKQCCTDYVFETYESDSNRKTIQNSIQQTTNS